MKILIYVFILLFGASSFAHANDVILGSKMESFSPTFAKDWQSFVARRNNPSQEWNDYVIHLHDICKKEVVECVNHELNKIKWVSNPGQWDTPSEFLAKAGDCKDFAAAKYTALLTFGISPDSMRILVLPIHAVLVVKTGNKERVLDNRTKNSYPFTEKLVNQSIYAVSDAGLWIEVKK